MATQKEIYDWNRKQRMNKDLCDWFKGLAPEKKKSFWKYDTQEAEQSRKAMDKEIANAEKNTVVSTESPMMPSKKMTREQFDGLTAREQMDYCLNGGQIAG